MKPHYLIFLFIILFSFCSLTCEPPLQHLDTVTITVTPEKETYKPGEIIKITYQGYVDEAIYDNAFIMMDLDSNMLSENEKIFIKEPGEKDFKKYIYNKDSRKYYIQHEDFKNFEKNYYVYAESWGHYYYNLDFYATVKEELRFNTPKGKVNHYFEFDITDAE